MFSVEEKKQPMERGTFSKDHEKRVEHCVEGVNIGRTEDLKKDKDQRYLIAMPRVP